jgi:hypothetical protein
MAKKKKLMITETLDTGRKVEGRLNIPQTRMKIRLLVHLKYTEVKFSVPILLNEGSSCQKLIISANMLYFLTDLVPHSISGP